MERESYLWPKKIRPTSNIFLEPLRLIPFGCNEKEVIRFKTLKLTYTNNKLTRKICVNAFQNTQKYIFLNTAIRK